MADREATTVDSTMVPPQRTITAPSACFSSHYGVGSHQSVGGRR
jgi:hypothetical protein